MANDLEQRAAQVLWRKQVADRIGGAVLSVSAVSGFMSVPTVAGVPTGSPTLGNGAMVIDTVNNRLYFYSSGAWRNAGP